MCVFLSCLQLNFQTELLQSGAKASNSIRYIMRGKTKPRQLHINESNMRNKNHIRTQIAHKIKLHQFVRIEKESLLMRLHNREKERKKKLTDDSSAKSDEEMERILCQR